MVKRNAMYHLHDNVEQAIDFPEIINADEVRVIELGHAFGLTLKRRAEFKVFTEVAG